MAYNIFHIYDLDRTTVSLSVLISVDAFKSRRSLDKMKTLSLLFVAVILAQDLVPPPVDITWANVPSPAQATNWNRGFERD
jgi:hypothetical protein